MAERTVGSASLKRRVSARASRAEHETRPRLLAAKSSSRSSSGAAVSPLAFRTKHQQRLQRRISPPFQRKFALPKKVAEPPSELDFDFHIIPPTFSPLGQFSTVSLLHPTAMLSPISSSSSNAASQSSPSSVLSPIHSPPPPPPVVLEAPSPPELKRNLTTGDCHFSSSSPISRRDDFKFKKPFDRSILLSKNSCAFASCCCSQNLSLITSSASSNTASSKTPLSKLHPKQPPLRSTSNKYGLNKNENPPPPQPPPPKRPMTSYNPSASAEPPPPPVPSSSSSSSIATKDELKRSFREKLEVFKSMERSSSSQNATSRSTESRNSSTRVGIVKIGSTGGGVGSSSSVVFSSCCETPSPWLLPTSERSTISSSVKVVRKFATKTSQRVEILRRPSASSGRSAASASVAASCAACEAMACAAAFQEQRDLAETEIVKVRQGVAGMLKCLERSAALMVYYKTSAAAAQAPLLRDRALSGVVSRSAKFEVKRPFVSLIRSPRQPIVAPLSPLIFSRKETTSVIPSATSYTPQTVLRSSLSDEATLDLQEAISEQEDLIKHLMTFNEALVCEAKKLIREIDLYTQNRKQKKPPPLPRLSHTNAVPNRAGVYSSSSPSLFLSEEDNWQAAAAFPSSSASSLQDEGHYDEDDEDEYDESRTAGAIHGNGGGLVMTSSSNMSSIINRDEKEQNSKLCG